MQAVGKNQVKSLAQRNLSLIAEALQNTERELETKIEKAENATAGNIPTFDSDGGLVDSGLRIATLAEVNAYLDTVFPL